MPNWCELLSPEKNIGEMQKMYLVQILQQVITVEVAVAHSAATLGRWGGQTGVASVGNN